MILSEIEAFDKFLKFFKFANDNKLHKIKFPIKLIDLSFVFDVRRVTVTFWTFDKQYKPIILAQCFMAEIKLGSVNWERYLTCRFLSPL